MKSRDLFQVMLRVLGVWFLFYGFKSVVYGIYYTSLVDLSASIVGDYLLRALPEILIGLYLFSGAKLLVKFCYGEGE